jgi:hydrogenase-4 membrane subunit HyfE
MDIINQILEFMRAGFDQVNAVQGLIIAAIAAFLLPSWNRLAMFVVGAAIVHVLVDVLLPVISQGAAFRLPDFLEMPFWRDAAFLLVGYLIVIAVFFFLKKLLLRR